MATSCAYEFQLKHFGFADCTAEDFYVSQWSQAKVYYLIYRILLFTYWTIWAIIGAVEYTGFENGWTYYMYLSQWDEWIMVLNFGMSMSVAIYGYANGAKVDTLDEENTGSTVGNVKDDLRWFHKICWSVRSASFAFAYLVTVLFWGLLGDTQASVAVNTHRHILNAVFATVDLFFSRVPVRLLHFVYPLIGGMVYWAFTLVLHASGVRSEIYENTLDWEKVPVKTGITCALAIFVAIPMFHVVVFGLYHLRAFIARRSGCQSPVQITPRTAHVNPAFEMEASPRRIVEIP